MKKFILPILLLHLAVAVNAASYYFSAVSGDDARSATDAQSAATPWKTIGKLNAIMCTLKPGDAVFFKRGETFDGAIVVTVSGTSALPITFGAYGTGNLPVINGFSTLSGWSQARTNVWEASFAPAGGSTNMVVKNNKQQAIGRYPNANAANGGYLTVDSHTGATELTSSQLSTSINWTGADVAVRKNRWVIDRSKITYNYGTTLGFVAGSTYDITDKFGFFIENHTNTLDQDGEWYYDNLRGKLQMYFSDNNPAAYTVKGSVTGTLVTANFQNYITFNNLSFTGANAYVFNLTNCSNITIGACTFSFSGGNAIHAFSSSNIIIRGSSFSDTNNDDVYMEWNCNNIKVRNNVFKNTGIIPGMGYNSADTYKGMFIRGDNNLIEYNEVDSTGFNGIHIEGNYDTVKNNLVNVFNFVKDDGGGVYTGQGLGDNNVYYGKLITGNIILNGIGAIKGVDDTTYLAVQGIYLDDNTNHTTVTGNTTAFCGQTGIFNHNSTYTTITGNTMYDNGKEQFLAVRVANPVSSVTLKNNIMFSKTSTQIVNRIESYYGSNNLAQFGTFDSNYYCRPFDNNYIFYSLYSQGGSYFTAYDNMDTWRSKFGFDGGSKGAPVTVPAFLYTTTNGINKYANPYYNQNVSYVNSFASTGDITTSWNPNMIDAGTLQVSSKAYTSNNNYMLSLPAGSVTAGQGYLLTFSLEGAASGSPMDVYLRKSTSPNIDLTTRSRVPVTNTRSNLQFGFVANSSNDASIELDVTQPNGAVYVDNVVLQEATVTATQPDDYILFQYNASKANKTITFSGVYYDATGAAYNGKAVLKPYTSIVLVKQAAQNQMQTSRDADVQAMNVQSNLQDASATSFSSHSSASINWQVANQSSNASYYTVERSADAANYTTIGKASVKTSGTAQTAYQYSDATPVSGKNYYRITQYDEKGAAGISKIVMVNNIGFKVNPNPARDVIHLLFDQAIQANDHVGKDIIIRSTAGVTVKTVQLPAAGNISSLTINVSDLQSGMYIVSITSEGKEISKPFLKQ